MKPAKPTKDGRCLCRGCGECFSSITAFEKHRRDFNKGKQKPDGTGLPYLPYCLSPLDAALVRRECKSGYFWGMAGANTAWSKAA